MPINTNAVTVGQVTGKTGTVTFRPWVASKQPFRPTTGGKSVPSNVNVSGKSAGKRPLAVAAKRPSTGGKTIQAANGVVKKRKVNRSKQIFNKLKKAQKETHLIIGKAHAERLLKKCLLDLMATGMRMSKGFKEDFRWALESYFVEKLEKMQTVAIHGGRVVVKKKDNILVRYMAGELDSRSVKKVAIV